MVEDVKGKKKGIYKYINNKKKIKDNVVLLLNESEVLTTQDWETDEVLNAFFISVFTSKSSLQKFKDLGTKGKVWSKEDLLLVEEDQVRDYLSKLDILKSMGPDEIR